MGCPQVGVLNRVLEEMERQTLRYVALSARLRRVNPNRGWTEAYTALRLGELLPCAPERPGLGGRYPLTPAEVDEIAMALGVPVAELLGEQQLALALAS